VVYRLLKKTPFSIVVQSSIPLKRRLNSVSRNRIPLGDNVSCSLRGSIFGSCLDRNARITTKNTTRSPLATSLARGLLVVNAAAVSLSPLYHNNCLSPRRDILEMIQCWSAVQCCHKIRRTSAVVTTLVEWSEQVRANWTNLKKTKEWKSKCNFFFFSANHYRRLQ